MSMFKVSPRVEPRKQPFSTCCWLTCLEMLFDWHNRKFNSGKDPDTILETIDQSPVLFPYIMETEGIDASECRPTARILGLRYGGDTDIIDPDLLLNLLKAHGPLLVNGKFTLVNGFTSTPHHHAIVVTGFDPDPDVPFNVSYIDPFRNLGTENQQSLQWLQNRGNPWITCDASIMYW